MKRGMKIEWRKGEERMYDSATADEEMEGEIKQRKGQLGSDKRESKNSLNIF